MKFNYIIFTGIVLSASVWAMQKESTVKLIPINYRLVLNKNDVDDIRLENTNIDDITEISCIAKSIERVPNFLPFKNVTTLSFSYNKINNVTWIKDIIGIKKLDLAYNRIVSIAELADCKKLKSLSIHNNEINDPTPLMLIVGKLKSLSIGGNPFDLKKIQMVAEHAKKLSLTSNLANNIVELLNVQAEAWAKTFESSGKEEDFDFCLELMKEEKKFKKEIKKYKELAKVLLK